jgi:hypothetical protein
MRAPGHGGKGHGRPAGVRFTATLPIPIPSGALRTGEERVECDEQGRRIGLMPEVGGPPSRPAHDVTTMVRRGGNVRDVSKEIICLIAGCLTFATKRLHCRFRSQEAASIESPTRCCHIITMGLEEDSFVVWLALFLKYPIPRSGDLTTPRQCSLGYMPASPSPLWDSG